MAWYVGIRHYCDQCDYSAASASTLKKHKQLRCEASRTSHDDDDEKLSSSNLSEFDAGTSSDRKEEKLL